MNPEAPEPYADEITRAADALARALLIARFNQALPQTAARQARQLPEATREQAFEALRERARTEVDRALRTIVRNAPPPP